MFTPKRRLYQLILRLHPAAFRNRFAREMSLDFEDALATYGFSRLLLDATRSLFRQWAAPIFSPSREQAPIPSHPLLAGQYMPLTDTPLTPFELLRGSLLFAVLLFLLSLAFSARTNRVAGGSFQGLPANQNTTTATAAAGAFRTPYNPHYHSHVAVTTRVGGRRSETSMKLAAAILALTSIPALAISAQTPQPKPELLLFHPSGPPISYEVATIKPLDPKTADTVLAIRLPPGVTLSPLSIRRYIMNAYGAFYAEQIIGGPDWLNKDAYQISAKPSAEVEAAARSMKSEDYRNLAEAMQQSLLADRFQLKAHFETRVLPVYELVPAKGGLRITAVSAPPTRHYGDPPPPPPPPPQPGKAAPSPPPGTSIGMTTNSGLHVMNASAISMQMLARNISFGAATELEPRPIVDHTGFTGCFDIKDLTWAPLSASATDSPSAPSLQRALEENLGIKIVPAKAPVEVLVIDHIDPPTPN
jgi:uncharacterized protein (TIGR03435 family)